MKIRSIMSAALAAALLSSPVHAQNVGEIVGGIARQYLGQEQDRAAYAQAQNQNTLAAYQSYLRQYPQGAYVAQARQQVQRLGGSVAKPADPVVPGSGNAASLTKQQRVNVQKRLTNLGYSTSGTDGSFGPGTRRAIALWQRDRNYSQTGILTMPQATEILRGTTTTPAPGNAATTTGPAQTEAALGLTRAQRSAVQAGLTRRGFDTNGVDGIFGRGTRNALSAWQRANDMSVTGYLTSAQVQRLAQ